MRFSGQDFNWTFTLPIWHVTAAERSVIEEEAQKIQILCAQVFPQEEIVAQPAVEIFDHGTGPIRRSDDLLYGLLNGVKSVSKLLLQVFFLLPTCRIGQREILKQKDLAHKLWRDLVLLGQEP